MRTANDANKELTALVDDDNIVHVFDADGNEFCQMLQPELENLREFIEAPIPQLN